MAYDPVRAGARPGRLGPAPLEVRAAGRRLTLRPGESLVVGRDEASDLQVIGPRVSREHLLIRSTPGGWQLVDRSRNGCSPVPTVPRQRVEQQASPAARRTR